MRLADRLFSFTIAPAKVGYPKAVVSKVSLFSNGLLTFGNSAINTMNGTIKDSGSFIIKDEEVREKTLSFIRSSSPSFLKAPDNLVIDDPKIWTYYFSFGEFVYAGSLLKTVDSHLEIMNGEQRKVHEWNNKSIDFLNTWTERAKKKDFCGTLIPDPDELHLLTPQSLCLLKRAKKAFGKPYASSSLSESIKNAAKLAFIDGYSPIGQKRFIMENTLYKQLLPLLQTSKSQDEFDTAYFSLTKDLASIDSDAHYLDICSWIDLSYLLLLLGEQEIIDERLVAFLHPPLDKYEILYRYNGQDESALRLAFEDKRIEADGYSPIYRYLIDIVGEEHYFSAQKPLAN